MSQAKLYTRASMVMPFTEAASGALRRLLNYPAYLSQLDTHFVNLGYFSAPASDVVARYTALFEKWGATKNASDYADVWYAWAVAALFGRALPHTSVSYTIDVNQTLDPYATELAENALIVDGGLTSVYTDSNILIYDAGLCAYLTAAAAFYSDSSLINAVLRYQPPQEAVSYFLAVLSQKSDLLNELFFTEYTSLVHRLLRHAARVFEIPTTIPYDTAQELVEEAKRAALDTLNAQMQHMEVLTQTYYGQTYADPPLMSLEAFKVLTLDGKSADEFATVSHAHPEYQLRSEPASAAYALVDTSMNTYHRTDFASVNHDHPYASKNQTSAHYLVVTGELKTFRDFAPQPHYHPQYVLNTEPVLAARQFFDGDKTYGLPGSGAAIELAPVNHTHEPGSGYVELLRLTDKAVATYRLNGKGWSDFAPASHEHPQYITQTEASAIGVTNPSSKVQDAKGVFVNNKTAHFIFDTLTLSGTHEVEVEGEVLVAFVSLINPPAMAQHPVVDYIERVEEDGNVKRVGVRIVNMGSEPVAVSVFIAYVPGGGVS